MIAIFVMREGSWTSALTTESQIYPKTAEHGVEARSWSGVSSKMSKTADMRNKWISSLLELTPLRIALLYAVLGGLWIYLSDSVVNALVHDPSTITSIAIIKGWAYVAATAYVLFLLVRRFEKTHLASEHQYQALLKQASDGILITDQQGDILTVNEQACQMLGYSERECMKLNMKDIFPPEDILAVPIPYKELLAGETVVRERRFRRKDGSLFFGEISGRMMKDGRLLAIVRDVSEHRQEG